MPFRVLASTAYREDLRSLTAAERARIQAALPRYLAEHPDEESAFRRPLDPNPEDAAWELRLGDLRVLYDIDEEARIVRVLRAGRKVGNVLYLRGRRIEMRFR